MSDDRRQDAGLARRTRGLQHGPITRLVSPGDLGRALKPFVFLDAVKLDNPDFGGFGWHPHSGIATVTVHFEGGSWAEESNQERHHVPAGGVEWVQAGGGVWHRGGPASDAGRVTAFQLWLALDEERELQPAAAAYFQPEELPTHGPVRVVLGEYAGLQSPVPSPPGITYLQISLADGEQVSLQRPAGTVAFLALVAGGVEVDIDGEHAGELDGIELAQLAATEGGTVTLRARRPSQLVYGHAQPHPHALSLGRYSVHTSPAALREGEAGIQRILGEIRHRIQG